MKRKGANNNKGAHGDLAGEKAALPQYFQSLLGGKSAQSAGAVVRPVRPFECLAFSVRGLMLAIPRIDSSDIVTEPSILRHVAGEEEGSVARGRSWCPGSFRYQDEEVMMANIAEIVIPPEVRVALADPTGHPPAIILIQGGCIGIACETTPSSMMVKAEDVCWSMTPNPRPWLAGVISKRYALLDTPMLCAALAGARCGGMPAYSGSGE